MKKLLIFALVAFGLWNHFSKNTEPTKVNETEIFVPTTKILPTKVMTQNFSCDGRQHCSQMNSRAEAEYFVKNCPNTKMDGDHDGIPCENDSRF
jgi:hypothetical protein